MWYTFHQNNTGGEFVSCDQSGIGSDVIIEANSPEHANSRAEEIGIYFDGCDSGIDCPCCGDRWSPAWDNDGKTDPMLFEKKAMPESDNLKEYSWFGESAYVHPLSGKFYQAYVQN